MGRSSVRNSSDLGSRGVSEQDLWDEARIFRSQTKWNEGLRAPLRPQGETITLRSGEDQMVITDRLIKPLLMTDILPQKPVN